MTRLVPDDLITLPAGIEAYDRDLLEKTGANLEQIALGAAAGAGFNLTNLHPGKYKVAVIPVTSGLGTIDGFAKAVSVVAGYLGFQVYITGAADVGGLIEAYKRDADVMMLADDQVFAAINLKSGRVVDNATATAAGYAAALNFMAGSLKGREVLLIGAGQVGSRAAEALTVLGANLIVFDQNKAAATSLVEAIITRTPSPVSLRVADDSADALQSASIIFDASPGRGFISGKQVNEKTLVAAPGIPLGLNSDAEKKVSARLIHDPLQIGVATMLYQALADLRSPG